MKELYVLMLSLHGSIRGNDLELGGDADTGGQTFYVVELARSLQFTQIHGDCSTFDRP